MIIHNRKLVYKAVAGSVNRNLHDENSDIDIKMFVLPTFDDLYESKVYKNFTTSDEQDVEIHDIRKLSKLLYNSNLSYLELFFSAVKDTNGYSKMDALVDMREELPKINLQSLYNSCLGMFNGQKKDLTNANSELQKEIISKYGYNTKKAMMAMHFLKFITRYYETDFSNFQHAIWYENRDRDFMLSIKHGKYDFYQVSKMLEDELDKAETLKSQYHSFEINNETNDKVNKLIKDMVWLGLK